MLKCTFWVRFYWDKLKFFYLLSAKRFVVEWDEIMLILSLCANYGGENPKTEISKV